MKLTVFVLCILPVSALAATLDSRLVTALQALPAGERLPAWVFFADKGPSESFRDAVPTSVVSDRSLLRRARIRPAGALVDYTDLPVDESYVARLAETGAMIRERSKWMNGASVSATAEELRRIETLPFVRSLQLVARFRRDPREIEDRGDTPPPPPENITSFDYGLSFTQVNQIGVAAVHDRGNYGQGVVVGVFDNGFRLLTHEVFDTLRPRIIATYDFVDHKVSVVPNNPDPGFGAHGVNTLSTIGGFKPGQLIGPAFGATYILARTENDSSETPFEEDKWVAAIEWADSIGVDVTSTSLGYLDYDAPYTSWTWQDMDGNTTVITRAADMAVGRGILVVNSAGNDGYNASHNTLGAPADGDSVFTIGAVTSGGTRSSFSSVGPTTDIPPRIKPDVMAMGSSVRVASATNPTGYGGSSGTSFSCPLAAGVAALMVHARPTDSPMEIIAALKSTASRAGAPDNQYGWGILNAMAALTPASVTAVSPADGASGQDVSVSLVWTRSRWAAAYHLQVAPDPSFNTFLLNDSTVTDTLRTMSGLTPGATYHWRVAAKNIYGTSVFSATRSFNIASTMVGTYPVPAGWFQTALSLSVADPSPGALFPPGTSDVYRFSPIAGYEVVDSLVVGAGYWVKFAIPETLSFAGNAVAEESVAVAEGWNLIGSISTPVDTGSVVTVPAGLRQSPFYRYDPVAGYQVASAIEPGAAYWVKAAGAGTLVIHSGPAPAEVFPGRRRPGR